WLRHSGKFVKAFEGRKMEAQVVFKRAGRYYFIGSECTGWDPNAARSATAASIWGPWRELGDPCRGPDADPTFLAPSAHAFAPAADPAFPARSPPAFGGAGGRGALIVMLDRGSKRARGDSRHVWLPVEFEGDGFRLAWRDSWDLSVFAQDPKRSGAPAPGKKG